MDSKMIIKDPVKFKHDLYQKSWEKSGAKNIDEYVKYVSENVKKSPLWSCKKIRPHKNT